MSDDDQIPVDEPPAEDGDDTEHGTMEKPDDAGIDDGD